MGIFYISGGGIPVDAVGLDLNSLLLLYTIRSLETMAILEYTWTSLM